MLFVRRINKFCSFKNHLLDHLFKVKASRFGFKKKKPMQNYMGFAWGSFNTNHQCFSNRPNAGNISYLKD